MWVIFSIDITIDLVTLSNACEIQTYIGKLLVVKDNLHAVCAYRAVAIRFGVG